MVCAMGLFFFCMCACMHTRMLPIAPAIAPSQAYLYTHAGACVRARGPARGRVCAHAGLHMGRDARIMYAGARHNVRACMGARDKGTCVHARARQRYMRAYTRAHAVILASLGTSTPDPWPQIPASVPQTPLQGAEGVRPMPRVGW